MSIVVVDDLFPVEMLKGVMDKIAQSPMQYGWRSNREFGFGHWNYSFAGRHRLNRDSIENDIPVEIKPAWELLRDKHLPGMTAIRCYANGHTYGVEGYPHTDSDYAEDRTVVLYLNEMWKREWAGETAFFRGDEIIRAVMPKFGRAVIFQANIPHVSRNVTRICPELRLCLVIKAKMS